MDRFIRIIAGFAAVIPAIALGQSFIPGNSIVGNGDPSNSHLPNPITIGTGFSVTGTYPNYTINALAGTATVTNFSFVNANGFSGSVATSTTTPALTLSTSVTGLLAGSSGAIGAATLTGDVSNSLLATTVVGVQGAVIPASAGLLGTNSSRQLVAVTTPLSVANGGNGTASPTLTAGTNVTILGSWPNYTISSSGGGGSSAWGSLTSGTNTTMAAVIGSGASIAVSGSGTIQATSLTALTGLPNENDQTVVGNGSGAPAAGKALVLGADLCATATTLAACQLINAQTGTTYAVASGDAGKIITFANSATVAVSLSAATTTGFTAGFAFDASNMGTGTVVITPTTSTINGMASLSMPAATDCTITSDGTNYQVSACTSNIGTGSQLLINLKSFGAKGNWNGSSGTNDASALSAAINTVNLNAASGIQSCIYAPTSGFSYYINGAVSAFAPTVPGCVTGDGQYLTTFNLGSSFSSASGYLFAQSEAWSTANASPNVQFNYGTSFIGSRYQGFMITGNTNNSGQGGIDFLDRNDMVIVRDFTCQYITAGCITIGITLNQTQAYMRESEFYNVKAWHAGSTTIPAIEIGSTTQGTASDATNELKWYGLNIFAAAGPSLVIDTNYVSGSSPKGTDDIMFFGTRIEQNSNSSASDMIRIGGTTNTGSVYNIQFHGLEFIGMLAGSTGFHVAGTSVTGGGQGDNGIIADGAIYVNGAGVGVQLDQGKQINITGQFPASLSTGAIFGSAVTCCVYVKQTGNATFSVTNNASANIVFQDGTFSTNGYAVDLSGNVHAPTHIATPSTIGALPTCNAAAAGSIASVSNGVASPTYLGTVSTTGAATDKVFCNGSAWVYD